MLEILAIAILLVVLARLNRRVDGYERRIAALEAALAGQGGPASAGMVPIPPFPSSPPPFAEAAPPPIVERADEPTAPTPPLPPASAPPRRGFEEALGTRWAVWVGGLALALGGVFLVRYSIEQDLVGPRVRAALGLAFAAALIAAGEWLRRRETPVTVAAFPAANVPAILTAAGTSTAFATVFAAYALYGLIGPVVAFVALGAVALGTSVAAALHGPALAGLGLVAALASPLLVETSDPSPVALVLYLVFAVGTSYAVARLRLWRWLAVAAAVGALLWGLAFVAQGATWEAASLVHIALQLALALLFLVADPHRGERDADAAPDRMAGAILFAFAALAVLATSGLDPGALRPGFLGFVAALMIAAAFLYPAAAPAAGAAAFATVGLLALWPVIGEAGAEPITVVPDLASAPRPAALSLYLASATVLSALVALPSLVRVALGPALRPSTAAWFLAASTLGPLAALVVAYWRVTSFDASIPFAIAAGLLAAAFAGAAGAMTRRGPPDSPAVALAIGATAAAAFAALAAGLTFAFDRGVLTVTLALSALGAAVVADRTGIGALRSVVAALGVAVAARLAWDPTVMGGEIGRTPILNWLLWGYGVPALAFWLAARVLARRGRDAITRYAESLAILFAALLAFLQIRHALHAGEPFAASTDHLEVGLGVTAALGFTLALTRLDLRRADPVYRWASLAFGALSIAGAALGLGLAANPYLTGDPILGGPVLNSLLPAYLIPAALAAALAWAARPNRPRAFVLGAAALALGLELAYAFLETRRLFQGPTVDLLRFTSEAELWCYSLILLVNGVALLAAGLALKSQIARLAGAFCLLATVLKVFIIDMAALEGLARALSFVGLGLTLVAVGLAYQRLLAPRPLP